MTSLVKDQSQFKLTPEVLDSTLKKIVESLRGRVKEAYVFGSVSTGQFHVGSDIDLLLVVDDILEPFIERSLKFADLYKIYPNLDVVVYSPEELANQLGDSEVGFWKSVRLTMKRIV